ncbi:MAG: hypothetical protein HUK00_10590 [Bacteroidaceae bacterium]|nr:hypothetical protein [Bacteroidaceae bacterium]
MIENVSNNGCFSRARALLRGEAAAKLATFHDIACGNVPKNEAERENSGWETSFALP